MKIKRGVRIGGLHVAMRRVLAAAESVWKELGRPEGVTVTSALDGVHSAGSFHYYGLALDFRTRYFTDGGREARKRLAAILGDDFDVIREKDHIHVEPSPRLISRIERAQGLHS